MPNGPVVFIINPAAGRGSAARRWKDVLRRPGPIAGHYELLKTTRPGDAAHFAREAAETGTDLVVACGGDGTVGEVANGLIGTAAKLAILPLGTGNDLARHFGLHKLDTACETLASGVERQLDAVSWQIGSSNGYFVNVAGAGFDAMVAERVNAGFGPLKGTSAYVAAVIDTLRKFQPFKVSVTVDGKRHETRAMLCAVANASSYGGGMRISPNSDTGDGLLEAILIGEVSKPDFLRTFPKVFAGRHLDHPAVSVYRGRHVEIESDPPIPVLCDGELKGVTPARFEVLPSALRILVPSQSSGNLESMTEP